MDMNCAYCAKGELVAKFGYEVCELPASTVYLFSLNHKSYGMTGYGHSSSC